MDAKREVQIRLIAEPRNDGMLFVTCPTVPIFSAIISDDKDGWGRALDLLNAHIRKNASASLVESAA